MIKGRKKIDYLTRIVGEFGGIPAIFGGVLILIWQILEILVYLDLLSSSFYLRIWSGTSVLTITILILFSLKFTESFQEKYGLTQKSVLAQSNKFAYFLVFLVYIFGVVGGSRLDVHYNLPFSITILLMSVFIGSIWWIRYRGVSNVLLYMAISFLLLSFAPWKTLYSMLDLVEERNTANNFYSLIGRTIYALTFIAFGSLDYYLLRINLKPVFRRVEEESYESV